MATTRVFGRLATVLLATATLATAARAGDWMPLLPDQDFYDFQLFAPPDLQEYEIYPEPSEGIFFSWDALYWGMTGVTRTEVGTTQRGGYIIPSQPISPQAIVQLNNGSLQASAQNPQLGANVIGGIYIFGADPLQLDLNTTWMRPVMTWGNRYEGGWIYDGRGMALSYFDTGEQSQAFSTLSEFAASSPTQIFTQTTSSGGGVDGGGGGVGNINQALTTTTITANSPPPDHLIAQKLTQDNLTRIQSVGAAMIWRRELGRRGSGSTARFGFGARYMQLEDRYNLGYESNQYAFNQGPTGGGQGQGVNINAGGAGAGGAGAGGAGAGGAGAGGAGAGGAGAGGAGGNQTIPGAFGPNTGLFTNSAGDVIGISGADTLTGQGAGSPLQTGKWETESLNNMVGPEFSLLLEATRGRWTFSSELKFVAGFNWQNLRYRGANFPDSIGADYLRATFNPSTTATQSGLDDNPITLSPPPLFLQIYGVGQQNATNDADYQFRFSPIGEWRFGGEFRVSQAITLRAGYTGMAIGSIARAAANTAYRSVERRTTYAEIQDPTQEASITNPWVVKTTGPRPADAVLVAPNTFKDPQGNYYTGETSNYYRQNPIYNRIGPGADVQDVVFVNGVDVGIEIKY